MLDPVKVPSFALTLAALTVLAAASSASAMTVSATIAVGSTPVDVAVNPSGTRAYVANYGTNSVSVIDTASNAVSTTISGASSPAGIAISSAGVGAVPGYSNQAAILDTTTNTVVGTASLPQQGDGVAFSPDGSAFYVAETSRVRKYSATAPYSILAQSAPVLNAYSRVTMSPDGARVWATSYNSGTVTVFNATTMATVQTITPGFGMLGIAITPDGTRAYAAQCAGQLLPIDTTTFAIGTAISVPGCPYGVAINPAGTLAAVARFSGNAVSAIDLDTATVVDTSRASRRNASAATCCNSDRTLGDLVVACGVIATGPERHQSSASGASACSPPRDGRSSDSAQHAACRSARGAATRWSCDSASAWWQSCAAATAASPRW